MAPQRGGRAEAGPPATACRAEGPEARPACGQPDQPCFLDNRCSTTDDPYAGLGCNAGGKGINCRYCGFGGYAAIPCPEDAPASSLDSVNATIESGIAAAEEAFRNNVLIPAVAGSASGALALVCEV